MRLGTDKLIVKALHAIEEAAWAAQKGPVEPSFALRFALAFLYEHGDGHRGSFDEFWRLVTDTGNHGQSTEQGVHIVRSNHANREVYGIYRAVGVYRSTEMMFFPALHKRRQEGHPEPPHLKRKKRAP